MFNTGKSNQSNDQSEERQNGHSDNGQTASQFDGLDLNAEDEGMPICHDYTKIDEHLSMPLNSNEGQGAEMDWMPVQDEETPEPPMFSSLDGIDSLDRSGTNNDDDTENEGNDPSKKGLKGNQQQSMGPPCHDYRPLDG